MTEGLPYQTEDLIALDEKLGGRGIIAWDMGLGKTWQGLAYALQSQSFPAIIVCPASLKLHWERQAIEHFGWKGIVLRGRTPYNGRLLKEEGLIIINYEILWDWMSWLIRASPKIIIADEMQVLGSLNSKTYKAFKTLCRGVPKVLGLSGTPLCNRPWELYPLLYIIDPMEFDSPFSYGIRYCDAKRDIGKWRFSGAKSLGELHNKLINKYMIRRTKEEVLPQLPPITRTILPLEIDDREEYDRAEKDLIGWLMESDTAAAIRAARSERYTKFVYLRHLVGDLKVSSAVELLKTFLQETDRKILIGTIHNSVIHKLRSEFEGQSVYINGSLTEHQRDVAEKTFKSSKEVRILFGQIQSAGRGLNLPEASIVGVLEMPWTPGACKQFINRAHRLNTKHQIDSYFFVGINTIDEKLCEITQKKQKTLDMVLDGVKVREDSLTIFDELQSALLAKGTQP